MDKETNRIAKKFAKKIKKVIDTEKIILFGSRARGDNFKNSDFDFIIVSEKFKEIPFMERSSLVYDCWDENVDIEAICYTSEEYKKKSSEYGIIRKANKEKIEL